MIPLDRFRREYQEYHRLSSNRISTTQNCLLELEDHAGKELLRCDADDIRSFLAHLSERLDVNTIRKRLNMIRPFYGWAWDAKLIDSDTYMGIRRVAAPRGATNQGLPRPYSKAELAKFRVELARTYPEVEGRYWKRWRSGSTPYRRIQPHAFCIQTEAIVALALHCGLRCQEIYRASIDDIHHDNAYVVVRYAKDHENGGKFREVPHTAASREAIRRWLELRGELLRRTDLYPRGKHEFPWLCLMHKNIALKPMRWNRFRLLLGSIGSGWELHRFRHTYGTEMLRATKRLEIVSRLLGHARIQQTLGYAELVRDDLQEAVERAEANFMEAVA